MLKNRKTIVVVGLGYVGLPLALLADKNGHKVIGLDNNAEKISLLQKRKSPLADPAVKKQLKNSKIEFTDNPEVLGKASVVVICVPTPVKDTRMPDLGPVIGAAETIGRNLKKSQLIILESTVNPGICEDVVIPILEKESGMKAGRDFYVAHCPERINPGDAEWNVQNIPRVVGGLGKKDLLKASEFYRSIIKAEIKPMGSLKEAEAVKIVENSFRDINIAFVNELAMSFSKLGIDVVKVIQGASTKPFAFMAHYPGVGVGGHCIPVDPYYLIEYAKENGFQHEFLKLARSINSKMPEYAVQQLALELKERGIEIKKAKIAVLGVAYKANIDDFRESPALKILKLLKKLGVNPTVYDPHVKKHSNVKNLQEAFKGRDAVLLATAHNEFKFLKARHLKKHGIKIIIDGRNCLDKTSFQKAGISYRGIGR